MRKPHPDNKLAQLTPAKQEWLYELLSRTKYADAIDEVKKALGLKTSLSALQRFYTRYALSQRRESIIEGFKTDLIAKGIDFSDDTIQHGTRAMFELMALEQRDPKLFLNLRRSDQIERRIAAEERKVKVLEEKHEAVRRMLDEALKKKKEGGGLSDEGLKQVEEAAALMR